MNVILDRFGRILIPKQIRDWLGLRPGMELRLEADEQAISLIPLEDQPPLETHGGVLVFTGDLIGEASSIAGDLEEERMRRLAGL